MGNDADRLRWSRLRCLLSAEEKRCARRWLIKTSHRISERPPQGSLSVCAQAARRFEDTFLDITNISSSSPLRTAVINVSITDGSLSSDGTAIAALPFSNSMGFNPDRTNNAYEPFGCCRHHNGTRCCFSTITRSPSRALDERRPAFRRGVLG